MSMLRTAYAGDVTALHPLTASHQNRLHSLVLAGCGPNALLLDPVQPSSNATGIIASWQVLQGDRVHGITSAPLPSGLLDQQPDSTPSQELVAAADASAKVVVIHGGRQLHVWLLESVAARHDAIASAGTAGAALCSRSSGSSAGHSLTHQLNVGQRHAWVMQAVLSQTPHVKRTAHRQIAAVQYTLAVGYINNAMEVWQLVLSHRGATAVTAVTAGATHTAVTWSARRLAVVESTVRCMLYSQALLLKEAHTQQQQPDVQGCDGEVSTAEVWIASGTIFNTILVWRVPALPACPLTAGSTDSTAQTVQPAPGSSLSGVPRTARACAVRQAEVLARCRALEAQLGLTAVPSHEQKIRDAVAQAQGYARERALLHGMYSGSALAQLRQSNSTTSLLSAHSTAATASPPPSPTQEGSLPVFFEARPVALLEGHEGAVFGVRWANGGARLLSVADDRAARVWELGHLGCALPTPHGSHLGTASHTGSAGNSVNMSSRTPSDSGTAVAVQCDVPAVITPAATLWGHTARVWDGVLLGDLAVTGSEDCSTKVWAWREGRCLGTLQGHKGRGVWHVEVVGSQKMLVTGGADASVKAWWLPAWLPPGWVQVGEQHWARPLSQHPTTAGVSHNSEGRSLFSPAPGATASGVASGSISTARSAGPIKPAPAGFLTLALPLQFAQGTSTDRTDSKGEWVRCMAWGAAPTPSCPTRPLYIGTNAGYLLQCNLNPAGATPPAGTQGSANGGAKAGGVGAGWSVVYRCDAGGPFSFAAADPAGSRVLLGHLKGLAVVVQVDKEDGQAPAPSMAEAGTTAAATMTGAQDAGSSSARRSIIWQASTQGVVSVFWCPNLGPQVVATSDAAACVRLWLLPLVLTAQDVTAAAGASTASNQCQPLLLAEARSHLGECLTCGVASAVAGLLLCGDYKGCVLAWDIPLTMLSHLRDQTVHPAAGEQLAPGGPGLLLPLQLQLVQVVKGVHSRSPVRVMHLQEAPASTTSQLTSSTPHSCILTTGAQDSVLARFECHAAAAGVAAATSASSVADQAAPTTPSSTDAMMSNRILASGTQRLSGLTTPIHLTLDTSSSTAVNSCGTSSTGEASGSFPAAGAVPGADTVLAGFKATQFVVQGGSQQDEVLRVECGGYRRPHAFTATSPHTFAFAYCTLTDHVLYVSASTTAVWLTRPAATAVPTSKHQTQLASAAAELAAGREPSSNVDTSPPACRTLHLVHHGREAHCVVCLPSPTAPPAPTPGSAQGTEPLVTGRCQQLCFLTASEDGTVRRVLYDKPDVQSLTNCQTSSSSPGVTPVTSGSEPVPLVFSEAAEVGDSGSGTAMRCLSSWPLDGHSVFTTATAGKPQAPETHQYLVVAGGAKEVLLAWSITWKACSTNSSSSSGAMHQEAGSAGGHEGGQPVHTIRGLSAGTVSGAAFTLQQQWLCTRPPKQGTRPQAGAAAVSGGDKRFMDIQLLGLESDHLPADERPTAAHGTGQQQQQQAAGRHLLVAASSDATLSLLALDLATKRWHPLSQLQHQTHPVLALSAVQLQSADACAAVAGPAGSQSVPLVGSLLVSGTTDGCITFWHITAGSTGSTDGAGSQAHTWPAATQPLLVLPGMHQSGVNALDLGFVHVADGPPVLCCVSGGDDQSLLVMQLQLKISGPSPAAADVTETGASRHGRQGLSVSLLSAVRVPNAHASALRSAALCAPHSVILSTGLDQTLRLWRLGHEPTAASCASLPTSLMGGSSSATLPRSLVTHVRHEQAVTLDVLEPSSLSWARDDMPDGKHGSVAAGLTLSVGVAGRGVQVVHCRLCI